MAKKTKKAAKPLNAKLRALIASAAGIGFDVATGYQAAVVLFRSIGSGNRVALVEAGLNYKAGYVARYLSDVPAFAKRWGNFDANQRISESADIYAKPYPESSKPNRRTALEHAACRAADASLSTAKRRAGIVAEKKGGRKPRPASNKTPAKAIPVDLVKASPKLPNKAAANDYFATAAAALLATCDKNARLVMPQLSSAVSDFKAAVSKALGQ